MKSYNSPPQDKMTIPKIIHGIKPSVTRISIRNFGIQFRWENSNLILMD
ncbi:MAG: hypothetical protein KDK54_17350 [Leptospiraceae bacterium]|nr:hypothetical protein [Leptospiraceae bacterium]